MKERFGKPPEIKLLHPGRLPEEVPPEDSCTLDLADEGPQTLERVADIYGLTREEAQKQISSWQDALDRASAAA